MKKKKSSKKLSRSLQRSHGFWFYIVRYFTGVLSLWAIAVLGLVFFPRTSSLPCGNSISCGKETALKIENNAPAMFMGKSLSAPKINLATETQAIAVLGTTTAPKHIYVDLSKQKLYAYEGDKMVYSFDVSTGKWGRTPTGDFTIWYKTRATRMTGGSGDDFYDLPNVEWTMFFEGPTAAAGQGFSLHAAYWHNNFGHPMSHGCVNMRTADAKVLYAWADPVVPAGTYALRTTADNPGTQITIYGEPPEE